MLPRGADAVVMVEYSDHVASDAGPLVEIKRPVTPGENVSYAGTDIARGETVLRAGQRLTSREIGVLAAIGRARDSCVSAAAGGDLFDRQRDRGAGRCLASGGGLRLERRHHRRGGRGARWHTDPPGRDPRRRSRARRPRWQRGCSATSSCSRAERPRGRAIFPIASCSGLGDPGVVAHGVALKPGKPICLAVTNGKPVVVLPGFPTSAIFTFHEFLAPVIRAFAGLPAERQQSVARYAADAREFGARAHRIPARRTGAG